jgi:hypothetical protein
LHQFAGFAAGPSSKFDEFLFYLRCEMNFHHSQTTRDYACS